MMNRLLFVDCASSGLLNDNIPLGAEGQPWICAIAAELMNIHGEPLSYPQRLSALVRANGRTITAGATAAHGIAHQMADRVGVSEVVALGCLLGLANQADAVVGYGVEFDRDIVISALVRLKKDTAAWTRPGLRFIDLRPIATAEAAEGDVAGDEGFRTLKLQEAVAALSGEPIAAKYGAAHHNVELTVNLYKLIAARHPEHFAT